MPNSRILTHLLLASALVSIVWFGSVTAQSLDRIVVNITPNQIVDQPLRGTAELLLFDSTNNLLDSFNIVDSPIVLSTGVGRLVPDTLSDPAYFSNGVVDLIAAGVHYQGPSTRTEVTASVGSIVSTQVIVSFSGYDLLGATFTDGSAIKEIFSGVPTSILARVQNNGNLLAIQNPFVRTYYKSGGGSVKVFFSPDNTGAIDTIPILLPDVVAQGSDTLIVEVSARYTVGDTTLPAGDTIRIPVTILPQPSINIVSETVKPDSVYLNSDFRLAFDVYAPDIPGIIDSTPVTVRLVGHPGATVAATLFSGKPSFLRPHPDTLRYQDLLVPAANTQIDPGTYLMEFDYAVYTDQTSVVVRNVIADSIKVASPPVVTVVNNSLQPDTVTRGRTAPFSFQVDVAGSDMLELAGTRTTFSLAAAGFSTTVSLRSGNGLVPGANTLTSDSILIPADLADDVMTADAVVTFRKTGFANAVSVEADFSQTPITVVDPITLRLVSTELSGLPNAPNANTSQSFQVVGRVENTSGRTSSGFAVRATSSGASAIAVPTVTVDSLPSGDTAAVVFDVTAAGSPSGGETITLSIINTTATVLPPVDNQATVVIQLPANLTVECRLTGLENDYLNTGERFGYATTVTNSGQSAFSPTDFVFTSNGVNLGIDDPLSGTISHDTTISLLLTAPLFDTVLNLDFMLDGVPLDLNTGEPAIINTTSCGIEILVSSGAADLIFDAVAEPGHLAKIGSLAPLFAATISNRGRSGRSPVRIESVSLNFTDGRDNPLSPRSVLNVTESGFYLNDNLISNSTAGSGTLLLTFDNFVIQPDESVPLVFKGSIKSAAPRSFHIDLASSDVRAVYTEGPLAGEDPGTTTPAGDTLLLAASVRTVTAGAPSFSIRWNPFNPREQSAEFSYLLDEPSALEFRVLSLTGELVYEREISESDAGTGSQSLFWDGHNDSGEEVLNGVYMAVLRVVRTGQQEIIKVAVVK